MQDAKKGMVFDSFPPVLQIQLRRFEYDFVRDVMVKVIAGFKKLCCYQTDSTLYTRIFAAAHS